MNGAGNDKPTTTGFFCSEKTRLGEVSSLAIKAQPSTPAISAKLRRDRGALGGVFFGLEEASRKLSAGGGRPMDDGDLERKGNQLEGLFPGSSLRPGQRISADPRGAGRREQR